MMAFKTRWVERLRFEAHSHHIYKKKSNLRGFKTFTYDLGWLKPILVFMVEIYLKEWQPCNWLFFSYIKKLLKVIKSSILVFKDQL